MNKREYVLRYGWKKERGGWRDPYGGGVAPLSQAVQIQMWRTRVWKTDGVEFRKRVIGVKHV